MSVWRAAIFGTAVSVLCPCTFAQQQPPAKDPKQSVQSTPKDRNGRNLDVFFEAMRDAHRHMAPRREVCELILHESIQKEIKLSPEDLKQIQSVIHESFQGTMDLRSEIRDQELSREVLVTKILERQTPFDFKVWELLKQNADFDRLLGIYVQARRFSSVANDEIAARIGLSEVELKNFREFRSKTWHNLMEETGERASALFREGKRWEANKLFAEIDERLNEQLSQQLTDAQRTALKNLEGTKFELPKHPFGMRGTRPRNDRDRDDDKSCCQPKLKPCTG